ncbi:MAG: asparaginase domain-containing protein [Candidatus Woesearchaeota archaeon]|nr:asparaginase domain-containing protein [Candidatus Woesearchaeota archaeon]
MAIQNTKRLAEIVAESKKQFRTFLEDEIEDPKQVVDWTLGKHTRDREKNRILVLYTGGTLGMEYRDGALVPSLSLEQLLEKANHVVNIENRYEIEGYHISHIDSTEINVKVWKNIAKTIKERYQDVDGVVVLHGTDTMSYTASALAFMMQRLSIPIVCTGAQMIMEKDGSDVVSNLTGALAVAASDLAESTLYFNGNIYRGVRVEKDDDSRLHGFKNLTGGPIGHLGGHGVELYPGTLLRGTYTPRDLKMQTDLATSVVEVVVSPLTSTDEVASAVQGGDCRALILRSYGPGNVPGWYTPLVRFLTKEEKIPVFLSSQCSGSGISPEGSVYAVGKTIVDAGGVPLGDMSPSAAVTKSMHVMAHHTSMRRIKEEMIGKSYVGEITIPR